MNPKDLKWPWRWDERPHGWYKAMGGHRYGPLPKREPDKKTWGENNTWPPRTLEPMVSAEDTPERFEELRDRFRK